MHRQETMTHEQQQYEQQQQQACAASDSYESVSSLPSLHFRLVVSLDHLRREVTNGQRRLECDADRLKVGVESVRLRVQGRGRQRGGGGDDRQKSDGREREEGDGTTRMRQLNYTAVLHNTHPVTRVVVHSFPPSTS